MDSRSSPATTTPHDRLLERLDKGAAHSDYPEAFGGSWPTLCADAARAIRSLARASPQPATDEAATPSEPGKLLPCPFCGEEPNCVAAYGCGEDEPNAIGFECENGCSVSKEKPTYEEAVTAWNTRYPNVAQRAPTREQIAAIIDPTAWVIDNDGYCIEQQHGGESLEKADAILALSSTDQAGVK